MGGNVQAGRGGCSLCYPPLLPLRFGFDLLLRFWTATAVLDSDCGWGTLRLGNTAVGVGAEGAARLCRIGASLVVGVLLLRLGV